MKESVSDGYARLFASEPVKLFVHSTIGDGDAVSKYWVLTQFRAPRPEDAPQHSHSWIRETLAYLLVPQIMEVHKSHQELCVAGRLGRCTNANAKRMNASLPNCTY